MLDPKGPPGPSPPAPCTFEEAGGQRMGLIALVTGIIPAGAENRTQAPEFTIWDYFSVSIRQGSRLLSTFCFGIDFKMQNEQEECWGRLLSGAPKLIPVGGIRKHFF